MVEELKGGNGGDGVGSDAGGIGSRGDVVEMDGGCSSDGRLWNSARSKYGGDSRGWSGDNGSNGVI